MKIHTCVRDAKRMALSELEAINRDVVEVQATKIVEDGTEHSETQEKEAETPKKSRKKKKEEDI